jgi:hypothetical protein
MSIEIGSSAVQMSLFVNNLLYRGKMHICKENKRIFLMEASMSACFSVGRDISSEPYIGIPDALLPFWANLSWSEAAVDYNHGYVYLVSRSLDTQEALMGIGLKFRTKRLAAIQTEREKGDMSRVLNFKKLTAVVKNGETKVLLSDEHIYTGLSITSVNSPQDLSAGVYDEEYANTLMNNAGVDESSSIFKGVM